MCRLLLGAGISYLFHSLLLINALFSILRLFVVANLCILDYMKIVKDDCFLAVLPLYHVYALIANFYGPMAKGAGMIFQPSLKGPDIKQSLMDNPVTIFPGVPQLWELFFDAIENKVRNESYLKHKVFLFLIRNAPVLKKVGLSQVLKKVFHPVHEVFGADMKFLLSGGAALKPRYFINYYNKTCIYIA